MAVLSLHRYRIEPNKTQAALLSEMLADFCQLYNAALEHRILAYEKGVSIRCNEQITSLPQIRKELPHQGRWSATASRCCASSIRRKAFFGRIKRGDKAGFHGFALATATTRRLPRWRWYDDAQERQTRICRRPRRDRGALAPCASE